MTNFRWKRAAGGLAVCWILTGAGVGWADPAHIDRVEDPYAPHVTVGSTARLGTSVGFLYGEPLDVVALGATAAFGHRFGRFALESEGSVMSLHEQNDSNTPLGHAERLGVLARFDVIRIGPRYVGGNSLLSFYVEGGADVAWNHWSQPGRDDPDRAVPADTRRVEGQAGFGLTLDHRLQEPDGFLHRIAWFLGWRMAFSPGDPGTSIACRGCQTADATAVASPPPGGTPGSRVVLRSMLFQSSLSMTW